MSHNSWYYSQIHLLLPSQLDRCNAPEDLGVAAASGSVPDGNGSNEEILPIWYALN